MGKLTRRDILKLIRANFTGLVFQKVNKLFLDIEWPIFELSELPKPIQSILGLMVDLEINDAGLLTLKNVDGDIQGNAPLSPTLWNKLRRRSIDRVFTDRKMGIVLHWFGDKNKKLSLAGYMRGFDSLRDVGEYETRTSAHFLIGGSLPVIDSASDPEKIGVIQTQAPDIDGAPFIASHIKNVNRSLIYDGRQYFIKALIKLREKYPNIYTVMEELFFGPVVDPNFQTIAIEITGYDFDKRLTNPKPQKFANVVAVVWALMKRYRVRSVDIIGHNELHLDKADPGKNFLAEIKFFIGVKALQDNDADMWELVFTQFLEESGDSQDAVINYFRFIRDYLVLITDPSKVYDWEKKVGFWHVMDYLEGKEGVGESNNKYGYPVDIGKNRYVDLLSKRGIKVGVIFSNDRGEKDGNNVRMITRGQCLVYGSVKYNGGQTNTAVFRHIEQDGSASLSMYQGLELNNDIIVGESYPLGKEIGTMGYSDFIERRSVKFYIAYGATWDIWLKENHFLPDNVGPAWLEARFLDPIEYLKKNIFYPQYSIYPNLRR